MPEYIKWDAPGVEVEQPGEKEKIKEVAEQFNRLQMMNFDEHHHCLQGTHLKTQGVILGLPWWFGTGTLTPRLIVRCRKIHRPQQPPSSSCPRHVFKARHIRCHYAVLFAHPQDCAGQCSRATWHGHEDLWHQGRKKSGARTSTLKTGRSITIPSWNFAILKPPMRSPSLWRGISTTYRSLQRNFLSVPMRTSRPFQYRFPRNTAST